MTLFDHALALILAGVIPVTGYFSFQKLLRRAKAGEAIDRIELYQSTMTMLWALFIALVILWFMQDRVFTDLGYSLLLSPGFLTAAALTIGGIILLVLQIRQIRTADAGEISTCKKQLGNLKIIVPINGNELGRFYAVSITAGIVEEALWRGFMIWYLNHFMPLWVAAVVSIIGFGIAHAYQGIAHLPRVTIVGAVFTGLFFLSGSLWLPMILHAAVDILQGRAGHDIMRRGEFDGPGSGDSLVPEMSP